MTVMGVTSLIGALAVIGTAFFSGCYSKDAIIEAVGESHRWGATYAYCCVLGGVFVTALYTFRMIFLTFHGPERFRHAQSLHAGLDTGHDAGHDLGHDSHGGAPRESPAVVTVPLIALAIPS